MQVLSDLASFGLIFKQVNGMLLNTKHGYGLVAIVLHWIVAFAFLANYFIVYWRIWFHEPRSDFGLTLLSTHAAIGISVLVFVVLRILWRAINTQPDNAPGSRLEHLASHAAHAVLYLVIALIPLTGYLGFGGPSDFFFSIEVPSFKDTWLFNTLILGFMGISWESFEGVMDFIHKQGGAYVVWVLIAVHAAAALFHHIVRKDEVLVRMINPKISNRDN